MEMAGVRPNGVSLYDRRERQRVAAHRHLQSVKGSESTSVFLCCTTAE